MYTSLHTGLLPFVSVGRLSTRRGGGTLTAQVLGRLRVCRAADTVTDWRQKLHGSWTAAVEQSAG